MKDYEAIEQEAVQALLKEPDMPDEKLLSLLEELVCVHHEETPVTRRKELIRRLFDKLRRLDVISSAMDDPEVTEIMINGPDKIFVERNGHICPYEKKFKDEEALMNLIQTIVSAVNRFVNEAEPIVDARLSDGSRVNIVLPPAAVDAPVMTIRKFSRETMSLSDLVRLGTLSEEAATFLKKLVACRYNFFVSGGTGAGKTTLLNCLSECIPETERVITIEDSAELQLSGLPNLLRLEARKENTSGTREITIRELIKTSLRMRPDRIVVGEVRGAEALDMLQSMNTGHDGSMSTGHANSPRDMLRRLETMVLMSGLSLPVAAIRGQIASAIDIIIQVGRLRDGSRKVLLIQEVGHVVKGEIGLNTLFQYEEEGRDEKGRSKGQLVKTGVLSWKTDKWRMAGLDDT